MSSKNAPKKTSLSRDQRRKLNREQAREQARLLREKEEAKQKRTRIIAACVGVLIIAAVIALTVFLVKNIDNASGSLTKGDDGLMHTKKTITAQAPANVTEYGGISVGKDLAAGTANTGVPQVDIYFDYTCSACYNLASQYDAQLGKAVKNGDITLVYHPVIIHNDQILSYTGAAADYFIAANEPDKYFAFHELVHEKVPEMTEKNLTAQVQGIVEIAREVGVSEENCTKLGEELTALGKALTEGEQNSTLTWIKQTTNQFFSDSKAATGGASTPSVYVDGEKINNWSTDLPELLNK